MHWRHTIEEQPVGILPILPIDHRLLRQQAEPVTCFDASLRELSDALAETLHAADGVGLAAPQVGRSLRLFVAEFRDERFTLCNPLITEREGAMRAAEACLSLPGYIGWNIRRSRRIKVEGQDLSGNPITLEAEGLLARILQHEIDHLDGILFLDHLDNPADLRRVPPQAPDQTDTGEPSKVQDVAT